MQGSGFLLRGRMFLDTDSEWQPLHNTAANALQGEVYIMSLLPFKTLGASEETQQIKVPATKTEDLSLTPGTHMMEIENPEGTSLPATWASWHIGPHVDTHVCTK